MAVGGRTGRDGIHGATFSSAELTSQSETVSGGAVQIGNAITEKMLLDVLLAARDRGLYHAVTDCGAGGFSSAVGEMGEKIGAEVWLDRVPLKYEGLSYTEIWISEAQERMVLAVPPRRWPELSALCQSEGVEATVIGRFVPTGRLVLKYRDEQVADLAMEFLHDGRPAGGPRGGRRDCAGPAAGAAGKRHSPDSREAPFGPLRKCRTSHLPRRLYRRSACGPRLAQRVQQGMGDPPVRPRGAGRQRDQAAGGRWPTTAPAMPRWSGRCWAAAAGIVIACGMNPRYGDLDTYWMAASAIDEAVRNCVAVGADPSRIAILDNFCWGNTDRPETLGSLVRAALACHDVADGAGHAVHQRQGQPEQRVPARRRREPIAIPPSLLISALGQIDDVRPCVTMDLKEPGNQLYLVGVTKNELGGSHFALVAALCGRRSAPRSTRRWPRRPSRRSTARSTPGWSAPATT